MRTQTKKRRKSRNFGYYVQEGLRGLLSHAFMSIAAIIIIAACLLITGSFSLVALNIQYNLEGLMAENEFLAYVDDTLTEEQARALQSQIESVPNVANVTFISAEEAKNSYLEDLGADDDLYSSLPSSVLRHRYSISVDDLNLLPETIQGVMNISGIAGLFRRPGRGQRLYQRAQRGYSGHHRYGGGAAGDLAVHHLQCHQAGNPVPPRRRSPL